MIYKIGKQMIWNVNLQIANDDHHIITYMASILYCLSFAHLYMV